MKLIQKYLPNFEYKEHITTSVPVPPSEAYQTLRSFDFSRSWLIRAIFTTREFLYGIFRKPNKTTNSSVFGSLLESALRLGWSVLEEVPNKELVMGAVTQPWEAKVTFQGLSAPDFITFSKPGFAKIAWNIAVQEINPGLTELSSETRVALTDPTARRKFRYYWFMFSPGIRLIRWVAIRMIKHDIKVKQP